MSNTKSLEEKYQELYDEKWEWQTRVAELKVKNDKLIRLNECLTTALKAMTDVLGAQVGVEKNDK